MNKPKKPIFNMQKFHRSQTCDKYDLDYSDLYDPDEIDEIKQTEKEIDEAELRDFYFKHL